MRIIIMLLLACLLPVVGAYTVPGLNVRGDIDLNSHKLLEVASPTNDTDGASKTYVVTTIASNALSTSGGWGKVNDTGDTMSGPLAMGANKVTGVANGTSAQDAVTYSQRAIVGSGSITINAPNMNQGEVLEYDVSIAAARLGDIVAVSPTTEPENYLSWWGYVPVGGTVTIRLANFGVAQDPASRVYNIALMRV